MKGGGSENNGNKCSNQLTNLMMDVKASINNTDDS